MTNLMKICFPPPLLSPFSICMILQDLQQFFFLNSVNYLVLIMQTNCDSCEIETRGLLYNLGELGLQTVCVICKTITCVKE